MPFLIAILCGFSILVGQYFYGGLFRPILAFPSYLLLLTSGFLATGWLFFSRKEMPRLEGVWLVVLFLSWIALRMVGNEGLPEAPALLELGLACFLMYLLMAYVVVRPEARIVFLMILLMGALVQSVVAGGQFFGVWGGQPQGWVSEQLRVWYDRGDSATVYRRAHGFYINGNHLAWFLNSAGFFALAMGAFGRGRAMSKVFWIYVGALCLAVSLLCLSRGGLLAVGAGMVFIFVLSALVISFGAPGRRMASIAILLGAFAIPAGLVFFILSQNDSIRARAAMLFDEGYRPQLWLTALREFQLYPWFGAGPGAFAYFARQFRTGMSATDDYFAHNDWLQLAADFGYPALVLALLIVLVHLTIGCGSCIRILRERVSGMIPQSNSAALLIGAATSLVAFSVHSFFDFNMQLSANALLAAACLGILVNSGQSSRSSLETSRWQVWPPRVGMVLLAGTGLWLLACLWGNRYEYHRLSAENYLLNGEFALAWQIAEEAASGGDGPFSLRYLEGVAHQKLAETAIGLPQKKAELVLAQKALRLAAQVAPEERSTNIELARNLLLSGRFDEAKVLALKAIHLEPRQVTGYELYGALLESEGDISSAQQVYRLGSVLYNSEFLAQRLDALSKEERPSTRK